MGIPIRRMRASKFGLPGQPKMKYNSKGVRINGKFFHSAREGRRYQQLLVLQSIGHIRDLETQVPLTVFINGIKITTLRLDFRYTRVSDGKVIHDECKGFRTPEYILKKKMVEAYFGIEILES